jgi:DNA-binding NarL/FixJ family response regulator
VHSKHMAEPDITDRGPILVVEDDADFRELVTTLLTEAGYTVADADSGEAALLAVDERPPALVILDVWLPGLSGYEVCRQLRSRFGEGLPVIFLSGTRTEPFDRVGGLLIGADDYIVKPFFADELIARIQRLLARSGVGSEAANDRCVAAGLTQREQRVLQLLAAGLTQRAIAAELHISGKTVAAHIQRILAKLNVHSRAEAVAYAYRNALVEVETQLPAGAT